MCSFSRRSVFSLQFCFFFNLFGKLLVVWLGVDARVCVFAF